MDNALYVGRFTSLKALWAAMDVLAANFVGGEPEVVRATPWTWSLYWVG